MHKPLYQQLEISPYDGLMLGYVPKVDTDKVIGVQTLEGMACILPSEDENTPSILIDVLPDGKETVKWYRVKSAAHECNTMAPCVELAILWHGAACDFEQSPYNNYPLITDDGQELSVRRYSKGPWIALTEEMINAIR
jgi:hypothetical protein